MLGRQKLRGNPNPEMTEANWVLPPADSCSELGAVRIFYNPIFIELTLKLFFNFENFPKKIIKF